jgi:uncharacterized protein YjbJ (UPF0337 family)
MSVSPDCGAYVLAKGTDITAACRVLPQTSQESKEDPMNWEETRGRRNQMKGTVKKQWGKLTDDDLTVIVGQRDQLVGSIQERYGIAKEEADKQVKT